MTGAKTFVRFEPGERVDFADQKFLSSTSQQQMGVQILDSLVLGEEGTTSLRVLSGFATTVSANVITVRRGTAIVGARMDGQTVFGCIVSGGEATKAIDVSSFPNTNHGVWVRFDFKESDFTNRLFWDAVGPPAQEVNNLIPTRNAEGWSMAIEADQPGPEWMKIAEFDNVPVVSITDLRHFFFDGRVENSFVHDGADWGTPQDRDDDRSLATTTITGLLEWITMINRQMQDVIGNQQENPGDGFWKAIQHGLARMLPFDGTRFVTGTLAPAVAFHNLIDLGIINTQRWRAIYVTSAFINGLASANRLLLTNPNQTSATTPDANTLYKGLIPKARCTILLNNSTVPTIVDSINVGSLSDPPTNIAAGNPYPALRFFFNTPFAATAGDHISVNLTDVSDGALDPTPLWGLTAVLLRVNFVDPAGAYVDVTLFKLVSGAQTYLDVSLLAWSGQVKLAFDFYGRQ